MAKGRYFRRGVTEIRFLLTIAAENLVPTRAEIDAGVDLSPQVADVAGFSLGNNPIATPDLSTDYDSEIPGTNSTEASSLTMYADKDSTTIRTALARGTEGYIYYADEGDVPTKKAEVYPVTIASNSIIKGMDAAAARYLVRFSITDEPNDNVTIPALVP